MSAPLLHSKIWCGKKLAVVVQNIYMENTNIPLNNQLNNNVPGKGKKGFSGPKIIFIILGIIILVEVVYAIRVLATPVPPPSQPVPEKIVEKTAGKISLNVPKTSLAVNEAVPVSVVVDTGGYEVDGVDVVVSFDPKVLEASKAGLVKGEIFDEYPLQSVDASKGLIYISGVNSSKTGFKGTGQFAVINLKAKGAGKASLTIDFVRKGATTDSNLVEMGTSKDILETVDNLELSVQ